MEETFLRSKLVVPPVWCSAGHVNIWSFARFFDSQTDQFREVIGVGAEYGRRERRQIFVADAHIRFKSEVRAGEEISTETRLVDFAHNRLHLLHEVYVGREPLPAAASEMLLVHIDVEARRACSFSPAVLQLMAGIRAEHAKQPLPTDLHMRASVKRPAKGLLAAITSYVPARRIT